MPNRYPILCSNCDGYPLTKSLLKHNLQHPKKALMECRGEPACDYPSYGVAAEAAYLGYARLPVNNSVFDSRMLDRAREIATNATCNRRHVGALIVTQGLYSFAGYNTSLPGSSTCDQVGHEMVNNHCVRTVHAEVMAIKHFMTEIFICDRSTIYVTDSPCRDCMKMIILAGIRRVVYASQYRDFDCIEYAKPYGVEVIDFRSP